MSLDELDRATAKIIATGAPAYYSVRKPTATALSNYAQGNQVYFVYGENHGNEVEGFWVDVKV
jgi:hypothetical protein